MYILNASFGSILLIVGAVLLIIYHETPVMLLRELPILHRFTGAAGVIIICFMMSTNVISAPSVSLENKNLWISRSLPIHSGKMLLSKAACHFVVTLPAVLIGAASYIIAVPVSLIDAVATIVAPTVFTAFCALVGVTVNLQFPKSDYINETAVIKQSPSVIISMLVNIGALLIPVGIYIFTAALIPSFVFMLLFSLMLAAVCVLLCRYLTHGGADRLESL